MALSVSWSTVSMEGYWLTMNGIVFGSGHGLTEVLPQHLHGGTDKNHKIIRIIAGVPDYT